MCHPQLQTPLLITTATGGSGVRAQVGRGCVVDLEWPAFVALEFELSVSKQKARPHSSAFIQLLLYIYRLYANVTLAFRQIWPHIRKILEVSARRATLRLI